MRGTIPTPLLTGAFNAAFLAMAFMAVASIILALFRREPVLEALCEQEANGRDTETLQIKPAN